MEETLAKGQCDLKLSLHRLYELVPSSGFMITELISHAVRSPFLVYFGEDSSYQTTILFAAAKVH